MKKSNKKIPKTHLPKYSAGVQTPVTRTLSNGNEVSYAEDNVGMSEGTQNIYNQKRSFGKNIGQYAGYAAAAGQTASNLAAINNQNYNGDTKAAYQSQAIGSGITQGMGSLSPYIAMGTGIRKSAVGMIGDKSGANRTLSNWAAAPHEAASSDIAAANNSQNTQSQKIGGYMSAIGDITGMSKMRQMFSYGTGNDEKTTGFWGKYNDLSGISARNNQKNSLEQENLAAQKAQEDAYAQQQTDYQNQQQSMMDAAFARGYANQNQTGGNTYVQYAKYGGQMKYAMGGMNKYPGGGMGEGNGQVELDENSIAPNGQFTQFNELDHNQQDPNQPNASLAAGEKVFSAKLKPIGSKKSFADLNKSNNTNREDKLFSKGNLDPKSEVSLKLTMMAKMKNSDVLFAMQEQLKKDKVAAYAKKMGVELPSMDNEQMEPQGKMAMGGVQLPYYNTDNAGNPIYAMGGGYPAMTNPYNNFKGSIPMYPDGGVNAQGLTKPQYEELQKDSMHVYKSGLNPNVPNWKYHKADNTFGNSLGNLYKVNGVFPTPTNNIPYWETNQDDKTATFQKPTMASWKEYIPATEKSGVAIESKPLEKPVSSPNWGSTTILKDGRHLRAYPDGHTEIVGNPRKVVNVGNLEKKKYGGQMLPKFLAGGESDDLTPEQQFAKAKFMGAEQNQRNLAFNQMTGNTNQQSSWLTPAAMQASSDAMVEDSYPSNNVSKSTAGDLEEELQLANDVIDKQHGWNRNDLSTRPKSKSKSKSKTDPNDKNFDWGSLAMNVGNFAGQNMGNIYDLSRKNAPLQKYDRATAKFLDPTKAIAGENYIYRQTKNTLPGLTGGNAGATMALLFANKANTATRIGRLRETYDNANAQIGNQTNQFNTEIAYREAEARAKDAAMKENVRSQAIHSIGSNFGKMTKSGKQDNMDQDTLKMFQWRYKNEPGFKKYIDNFSTQNNSEEAIV